MRRDRRDPPRPETRCFRPGAGRHGDGNRVPDARHVVTGHPAAQIHDRRRQERLTIEYFDDVLELPLLIPGVFDDAANDRPISERHAYARADRRLIEPGWNVVGEPVEEGNRNRNRDQRQYFLLLTSHFLLLILTSYFHPISP